MATKTKNATEDETEAPEAATMSVDEGPPQIGTFAVSTCETDFVGRALVTPGTVSKDYLGRLTTATHDYLGRALLDA